MGNIHFWRGSPRRRLSLSFARERPFYIATNEYMMLYQSFDAYLAKDLLLLMWVRRNI